MEHSCMSDALEWCARAGRVAFWPLGVALTLLLADALINANKNFDLIMLPNRNHGFGNEPYMVRRRWDYFVRYLLGVEPPHEYQLHPPEPTAP